MASYLRLRTVVESSCRIEQLAVAGSTWPARAALAIRAALDWAAADPAGANVLTNEALARGRAGRADYDRMLDHFAALLAPGRQERPDGDHLPGIMEKALVGGLAMLIANRLELGRSAELSDLAPEAIQLVLTPYLGPEEALAAANAAR